MRPAGRFPNLLIKIGFGQGRRGRRREGGRKKGRERGRKGGREGEREVRRESLCVEEGIRRGG